MEILFASLRGASKATVAFFKQFVLNHRPFVVFYVVITTYSSVLIFLSYKHDDRQNPFTIVVVVVSTLWLVGNVIVDLWYGRH